MRINTNVAALNSYNQLSKTNDKLSKSLSRLSSGKSINGAADDAAGLAISEKMNAQTRGLAQAQRNAQDGISMIQTAEGALKESHSILQRMRELSVQSANDTNTAEDRAEIQKEVDELASELTRISNNTEFNTQTLLNGAINKNNNDGEAVFQIGSNAGQNIKLGLNAMDAQSLGVAGTATTVDASAATNIDSAEVDGTTGSGLVDGASLTVTSTDNTGTAADVSLSAATANTEITVTDGSASADANGISINLIDDTDASDSLDVSASGSTITIELADTTGANNNTSAIQSAIQGLGTVDGVDVSDWTVSDTGSATWDGNVTGTGETGAVSLSGGSDPDATETIVEVDDGTGNVQTTTVSDDATSVSFDSGAFQGLSFTTSDVTAINPGETLTVAETSSSVAQFDANGELTQEAVAAAGIDVSSQSAANDAIATLDDAIKDVSAERSKLGAYQNRLDHTINNLNTAEENLTAAESRISDVDMAREMMNMSKQQILSQAGTAMMAQANQLPQGVLQLLG